MLISAKIKTRRPSGKLVSKYKIKDISISIYKLKTNYFYFVNYPEKNLSKKELNKLNRIYSKLLKLEIDFNPKKIKNQFKKQITTLTKNKKLFNIICRHTIGYGVIEPLLADKNLQDIYIDSSSLVHLIHSDYGEILTNICFTNEEAEKLSTRLRMFSGKRFDFSNPVLDTVIKEYGVRVCAVSEPFTYNGIGFAFRKRRSQPWTLSDLIKKKMMSKKTSKSLLNLIQKQKSILITGPRSSGKTSLLTALIQEIPKTKRIILIEDTPEIPVALLRRLGFKIEHLKTNSFDTSSSEKALRTSLRLGDSVLILGEVRGKEVKSLFEAMRIGVSNTVLGTIHGSGPYSTFDRIVHDIGIPPSSFKAIDNIISLNGNKKIISISKVGKRITSLKVR